MRAFALLLLVSVNASAQERLLVPAYTDVPLRGANGWTFSSQLDIYTGRDAAIGLPDRDCRATRCFVNDFREFFPWHVTIPGSRNGRFIVVDDSSRISTRLVLTVSPSNQEAVRTVRLPVVSERDFRTGPYDFLRMNGITAAADSPVQYTLRIYLKDEPTPRTGFDIRVWTDELVNTNVLAAGSVTEFVRDGNDRSYPWYAVVRFPGTYSYKCVPPRPMIPCFYDLRLHIAPRVATDAWWPLITAIDYRNEMVFAEWPQ